jgi:hypothetical protein
VGITGAQVDEVPLVVAALDRARNQALGKVCGAEVVVALDPEDGRVKRLRQQAEPDADARGEGLAVGAGVDDAVGGALDRERGGDVLPGETQLAIGGVLEQVERGRLVSWRMTW